MMKYIKQVALVSALVTGATTSASAAIVANGGFETGDLTGWHADDNIGTTPGQGITVITTGGTNSTGYGDNVPSREGTHAAYFVDDNAFQNLSQWVTLAGNTEYTLKFSLFATESGSENPFNFNLTDSVGLSSINFHHSSSVLVGDWTDYSYNFTTILPFSFNYLLNFNFISGHTPAKDVLLDGVSIAAVPEPATWGMMIAGLGLVGFAMRRRTTNVQFA